VARLDETERVVGDGTIIRHAVMERIVRSVDFQRRMLT
jgi:hypothetical protein